MDDRSPHPYDEVQVDKFPFDEKEDQLRGTYGKIRRAGILKNKNSNSNMRKRQQQHHNQHQQQQHHPHVYFQTAESMKAFAHMEKKPSCLFDSSRASYLYPDSAAAVAADTSTPTSNMISFLQKPAHQRHATYAASSAPPPPYKQIAVGSDIPRAPQRSVKVPPAAERPASPASTSMANLLQELSPAWQQYFDLSSKDNGGEAVPSQSSGPDMAGTKQAKEFYDHGRFVPKPSEQRQPPSSSLGVLEILPELSPVWNRYLDLSKLSASCHGGQQRPHPWCVDGGCAAPVDAETKSDSKHQQDDEESKKDRLPADGPPKIITVKPDLPKIITVTPNTRSPPNASMYPPEMITTQATMLTTSTTMTTTMTTTTTAQTTIPPTNNNPAQLSMPAWTSPPANKSQPPAWSCLHAPTPSPMYMVPMGRPTRPIPTTTTTTSTMATGNSHRRRRRRSSPQPQRLDWSHRLDVPLRDAVAAAAAAATSQNESTMADTPSNAICTALVPHRPTPLASSSLDMATTPVPTAMSSLTSSSVQVIGPPHLCIYKVSLPAHLLDLLDPLIQKAEDYAKSLPRGWRTNLFSLSTCPNFYMRLLV